MNPPSISHIWRHILRHWQLYGLVLLLLTAGVALLGSIPLVARQLATRNLRQSLPLMPVPQRNVLLRGGQLTPDVEEQLQAELGSTYLGLLEMKEALVKAQTVIQRPDGLEQIDKGLLSALNFHLYSMGDLEEMVTVVDGRKPNIAAENAVLIEAAIGQPAAAFLNVHVGDVLYDEHNFWHFQIVGIVEATDPQDERWWGDDQLLPLSVWQLVSPDFIEGTSGLLIDPQTMQNNFISQRSWRVLLDSQQLNEATAPLLADQLRRLESNLTSRGVALDTGLIARLDQFEQDMTQGQISLLLLISQSLLALLYTLAMLGQMALAQAAGEIATLSARGFGRWQVTKHFGLRYGLLALLAWPLGVGIAVLVIPQMTVPRLAWGLGGVASLFGWLALLVAVPATAQRGLLVWLKRESRPEAGEWWRWLVLDTAVLALGALSYWQLRQFSQQALVADEAITPDPLLLLGPTIFILGLALLLRHIAPLIIRLGAWLAVRSQSGLLPLAMVWLGRDFGRSSRIIFMVSVATGLALFAAIFTDSLTTRQDEMALYHSGADLRWSVLESDLLTVTAALQADEAVAAVATFFRGSTLSAASPRPLQLLGVPPDAINVMAPYPTNSSDTSLAVVMAGLANPTAEAVPVLLSRRNVIPGAGVGSRLLLRVGALDVPVEVRDVIDEFATLQAPFVVMNLAALRPYLTSQSFEIRLNEGYEVWARVDSNRLSVIGNPMADDGLPITGYGSRITDYGSPDVPPRLLGDAAALRMQYGHHLLSQQILGMFRLNVWILVVLSFTSLLVLQLLDGWRRRPSWGTLMTIGVSRREVTQVMMNEGAALAGVGLVVGVGLGLALARITLPLLAVTLSASMGDSETAPLLLDWLHLGRLLLTMALLYGVAIIIPAWVIGRVEMVRLLRWQV